jgi:hypothetical protein
VCEKEVSRRYPGAVRLRDGLCDGFSVWLVGGRCRWMLDEKNQDRETVQPGNRARGKVSDWDAAEGTEILVCCGEGDDWGV